MLIRALCDYADQSKEKLPEGWMQQKISFRIMLTPQGEVAAIVDVRKQQEVALKGGKTKTVPEPTAILLPSRNQKSTICSNLIEHRPLYIFGLNLEKDTLTPEDKTKRAQKSHAAFVQHNLEFFQELDSPICKAYCRFLENWDPAQETANPALLNLGKDYSTAYFGFSLDGFREDLEKDKAFVEKYNAVFAAQSNASDDVLMTCGILGEKLPMARTHDKIKFPGAKKPECVLVSMNDTAFESYGKTQSYNSNISHTAMKKYTTVLNQLLSDKTHWILIEDMVLVFFAMKTDDSAECSLMSLFFGDASEKTTENLKAVFQNLPKGKSVDLSVLGAGKDVTFYIAGLTANGTRLCQKFIWRDKFGNLVQNLVQHQRDLQISTEHPHPISFARLGKELLSPIAKSAKVPPPLMTDIMFAAFHGTAYPTALLETVVRRVKTDSDDEKKHFFKISSIRAGIIKACINRNEKQEELTMALNLENDNPAYLCGRLFAVYEKIQKDSSGGGLNRTIKDSYFASACARPSAILTKLSHLAQNHMRKLEQGSCLFYNQLIGDIMNRLDGEFPQTLDLDSQGRFIVGYYQQNMALYQRNA